MTSQTNDISDAEIMAETIRYARSGKIQRAATILRYLQEDFPGVPEERLRQCMAGAADLLKKQHEN